MMADGPQVVALYTGRLPACNSNVIGPYYSEHKWTTNRNQMASHIKSPTNPAFEYRYMFRKITFTLSDITNV